MMIEFFDVDGKPVCVSADHVILIRPNNFTKISFQGGRERAQQQDICELTMTNGTVIQIRGQHDQVAVRINNARKDQA